jgi:DNA-binding MarR family transcriptional regulator
MDDPALPLDAAAAVEAESRANSPSGANGDTIVYGDLHDLLGYHLRRAQVAVFQNFAEVLNGAGEDRISPGQVGVLVLVRENPGVNQTRLGNALGIDRSTLVAVIDRLEARGLLKRTPSPRDRRSHALVLTRAGRSYIDGMMPRLLDHERRIAMRLTQKERATLIDLLQRVGAA